MHIGLSDIVLDPSDIVAEGGERWVYAPKTHPSFVFKLQKPIDVRDLKNNLKGNSMRWFPSLGDRIIQKEYKAYIDSCLASSMDLETIPVSKLYGFAQSNVGLVQIAERVSLDGADLGPTLAALRAAGGITDDRLGLLNDFAQLLLGWNLPTNDISARNIVLGLRGGREKFIAVDGFGDIDVIPLRTYSRRFRRTRLGDRMTKLAKPLGVQFDTTTFQFSRR